MDVSENNGTPKSSILIGFSIINHPFWDTPIFGNTHIHILVFYLVWPRPCSHWFWIGWWIISGLPCDGSCPAKWKSGMAVTSIWVKCNSLISNMLEFGKGNALKNDQTRRSTGVDQQFPNEKLECRRWSWWKVCQDELFPEVTCT